MNYMKTPSVAYLSMQKANTQQPATRISERTAAVAAQESEEMNDRVAEESGSDFLREQDEKMQNQIKNALADLNFGGDVPPVTKV